MKDEFYSRHWAENHNELSDGIDKLAYVVGAIVSRRRAGARRAPQSLGSHIQVG
ncbi:MAG: hypothetical protein WDN24_08385 [Sphingomonas sp.]